MVQLLPQPKTFQTSMLWKMGSTVVVSSTTLKPKIILNLEADEVDAIRDIVRLTPLEAMKIENLTEAKRSYIQTIQNPSSC